MSSQSASQIITAISAPAPAPVPEAPRDNTSAPQAAPEQPQRSEARDAGFTDAQMRQIADDGVKKGVWTREQADQMLRDEGVADEGPDTRTPEQIEFDKNFPPARPEEFEFPRYMEDPRAPITPEMREFETTTRGWMAEGGFTRQLGSELAKTVYEEGQALAEQTPADAALYKQAAMARLERVYGDALPQKLDTARAFLREIEAKRPGIRQFLEDTRLGNSPRVIGLLITQAERRRLRNGG